MEDHAKEIEHSSLQEKLDRELKELDKKLEQKEVKISASSFKFHGDIECFVLTMFISFQIRQSCKIFWIYAFLVLILEDFFLLIVLYFFNVEG